MSHNRDTRAFTLLEALVATALLVVLGTVIWQLLAMGIRAHERGEASRTAQAYARQVVNDITGEISSAAALPEVNPLMYSAVLYPDPWGSQAGVSFTPASFYSRTDSNVINGVTYDEADNLLIITRAGKQVDTSDFNPGDIGSYVYVEYVVPKDQPNVLLRNVYSINPLGTQGQQVRVVPTMIMGGTDGSEWVARPSFFQSGTKPILSEPILELPKATDRVTFSVSHSKEPATETSSPAVYDPRLFTVTAHIRLGLLRYGKDPNNIDDDQFMGKADLQGQVRVQSNDSEY